MAWFSRNKLKVNRVDGIDYLTDPKGLRAGRLPSAKDREAPELSIFDKELKRILVISLGTEQATGILDTSEDNLILKNYDRMQKHKKQQENLAYLEQKRIQQENELKVRAEEHLPALLERVELERAKLAEKSATFDSFHLWGKLKPEQQELHFGNYPYNQAKIKNILLKDPSEWQPQEVEDLYTYFNKVDETVRMEAEVNKIHVARTAQAKLDAQALVDVNRDEVLEFLRQEKLAIIEAKHKAIAYYESFPLDHAWEPKQLIEFVKMFPADSTISESLHSQMKRVEYARRADSKVIMHVVATDILETVNSIVE